MCSDPVFRAFEILLTRSYSVCFTPAWHEEELNKRVAALDSGEEVVTPWETAKERIRQRAEHLVRPG